MPRSRCSTGWPRTGTHRRCAGCQSEPLVATLLWLLASIGFSLYVSTFGNYAKTYGVFAGIIVLLLWLWITSYAVLLGAEINAEAEQQTLADATRGPVGPLGRRNGVKTDAAPADSPPTRPLRHGHEREGR